MSPTIQIDPSSVFLVTGGARGIAARCTIALAQEFQCRWILLGRTKLEPFEPEWAQAVREEEPEKIGPAPALADVQRPQKKMFQSVPWISMPGRRRALSSETFSASNFARASMQHCTCGENSL